MVNHHAQICEDLSTGHYEAALKELGRLGPVVDTISELDAALKEHADLLSLVENKEEDPDVRDMAKVVRLLYQSTPRVTV